MATSRYSATRWLPVVVVIALGAYATCRYVARHEPGNLAGSPTGASTVTAPAVPVTVATVQQSDFPVYLNGLGTVQPFRTVIVRIAIAEMQALRRPVR